MESTGCMKIKAISSLDKMDPSTRVIDFCHSELGTSFNCEGTVFEDNYGPSNLLSLEEASKTKGLRVETYVRPPVKITLTFKKPIHLSHVEFTSPSSQFIEIYGSGSSSNPSLVGKVSHQPGQESKNTVLKNYYFPGNRASADQRSGEFRLFTPSENRNLLKGLTSLTIRIVRVKGPSVISLQLLRVFGTSDHKDWRIWADLRAKKASQAEKESKSGQPRFFRPSDQAENEEAGKILGPASSDSSVGQVRQSGTVGTDESAHGRSKTEHDSEIDRHFLDALTFELMRVPMVLPSGQTVDRSTVERHNESELKQGRLPNDPFTGRTYQPQMGLQPKLDTALKARIDSFVLERHGQNLTQVLKRNRAIASPPTEEPAKKSQRTEPTTQTSGYFRSAADESSDVLANLLKGRRLILGDQQKVCVFCSAHETSYKITACSHLLCRDCALNKVINVVNKCPKCAGTFSKDKIVKHHRNL